MIRGALRVVGLALLFFAATRPASASIGLVVGEPFGSFGTMMPSGHAAIYLDHLCAETPTQLRLCNPGEAGVVISRYHDLRATHVDWMATPATTFFYGVDDPANAPGFVTASLETELRETYREQHLLSIVPNHVSRTGATVPPPYGDWEEGIGAAFDRRLFLYTFDTTAEQDAVILALLNGEPDQRRYTLRRANCADFAADLLSTVLPGVFHRSRLADFDLAAPKTLAHQLDTYGKAHPEIHLRVSEIPQVPGTLRRSRPLRGGAETFLKTKRYLATLLVIQPEVVLADWIVYETKGKWTPGLDATTVIFIHSANAANASIAPIESTESLSRSSGN
jgi:hypothetical protein